MPTAALVAFWLDGWGSQEPARPGRTAVMARDGVSTVLTASSAATQIVAARRSARTGLSAT